MFIDVHNRPMVNITLECLEFYEEEKKHNYDELFYYSK